MNKKIYSLILWMVAMCTMFSACSDSSVEKTPLQAPVISEGGKTVSSLSFSWSPVEGASQYAYELYDAQGSVVDGCAGITNTTSLLATGLQHNATYTLKVWAYSPVDGNKTTSPIATLTATTNAPTQLNTLSNTEVNAGKRGVTVTWPAVENADTYKYSYTNTDGSVVTGSTDTNSLTLNGLETGDYTLTIVASSNDENYSDSDPFSTTFSFVKAKEVSWTVTGQYYSAALNQYFDAELVSYDDGTYTINKPLGEEGYSFDFVVKDGAVLPADTEEAGWYTFNVSNDYYNYAYFGDGYSSFTGNSTEGQIYFYNYLYYRATDTAVDNASGTYYDYFTWETQSLTIDDICGSYTGVYTNESWGDAEYPYDMTITKTGDNTVSIYNIYGWEDNTVGTVDLEARTITIEPQTWASWYTIADYGDKTKPVVATINSDNTITFSNFGDWYGTSPYYIGSGTKCVMTKKTSSAE